jgi:hypothetical protein
MSIKVHITDPLTGRKACVVDGEEENALVVATRVLKTYENTIKFFSDTTYGSDMNQDASFSGTPENVHNGNGIDDVYWTASSISGVKYTFNYAAGAPPAAHGGTNVIRTNAAAVGNVMQIDKGSNLTVSSYTALTIWIKVINNWAAGDSYSVYGWDTGTVAQVGTAVFLEDYFSFSTFNTWHLISIPLTDMGLTSGTIDAIRIEAITKSGAAPDFYMDDIQFQETGGSIKFVVNADKDTWFHVDEFTISVADAITGTLADATMPYLAYDKFLGVTLTVGLNYQRVQDGKTLFTQTVLSLMDFMQLPGTIIAGSGSDGTNTWVTLRSQHMEPLLLKPENDDELSFTVSDNLSGLLHLRISAGGRTENRA